VRLSTESRYAKRYVKEPAFVLKSGTTARQALTHRARILAQERKNR
jgi:hypothetical protein